MMLDKDCHHDCNQNQCPFAQDTRNPNRYSKVLLAVAGRLARAEY